MLYLEQPSAREPSKTGGPSGIGKEVILINVSHITRLILTRVSIVLSAVIA